MNNTGIRPYSKRELAALYEVTPRAFYTMFKKHSDKVGEKEGRYYNINQVILIFRYLGMPPSLLPDDYEATLKGAEGLIKRYEKSGGDS